MHLHGGDVYRNKNMMDFSSNINMLGIPKKVIQAAKKGVKLSACYPDINSDELRNAISNIDNIPVQNIICGNGAAELIFAVVMAVKPRKALLPIPSFYEYEQALRNVSECDVSYYTLEEENGFQITEEILHNITDEFDIIFLCNPNNPTGTVIKKDLMEKIIRKCEKEDVFLVLDECFGDMLEEPEKYTVKENIKKSQNLFILKAFTKMYGMAGLRLGYAYSGNLGILKKMNEVLQPWNVSIPAQMAGVAALREKKHVVKFKRTLKEEKEFLMENLEKAGFKIYSSKANYIFLYSEMDLYTKCYNQGFLIRDCSNYVGLGKGYYRIAVKNHYENKKLIAFLKSL